jgi:hypothetical protein
MFALVAAALPGPLRYSPADSVLDRIRKAAGTARGLASAARVTASETARLASVEKRVAELEAILGAKPWKRNLFIPSPAVRPLAADAPFMAYSTCSATDFFHPRYAELAALLRIPLDFHRKYWEWVCILNTMFEHGLMRPGVRAMAFGVAREPVPAVLAKYGVEVTATDAPSDAVGSAMWKAGGDLASSVESLRYNGIVDRETLHRLVTYDACDMRAIPDRFRDYDFIWSSCCFEHLGSLQAGLDFVVNSVEQTLRPGGVACHTTEFNLSSNDDTLETGLTVVYRRRDLEGLIAELRSRGHDVRDLVIAPDGHHLDGYVDTPPCSPDPHLRLDLEGYASTSVALVIRRGG